MKLRWAGALVMAVAPLACSLIVDTDNLDNGGARIDGGGSSSGSSSADGPTSSADGNVGTSSSSGDVVGGEGGTDSGTADSLAPPPDAPVPRFCSTVKPSLKLQFCDDFDDEGRTTLFTNGWSVLQGAADKTTELSLAGEPVKSGTRSARVVQDVDHPRTRVSHVVTQGKDFALHFKWYRTVQNESSPVAVLQGPNCAVAIGARDIYSFCPDFANIYDLPDQPDNTWNEMTIVVEEHSPTSRFFITAPGVSSQRVDVPPVQFGSLELGQATNDGKQTVFYDDVWVEGGGN